MLAKPRVVLPPTAATAGLVTATLTAHDVRAWQHTGLVGGGVEDCCRESCPWWFGGGVAQRGLPATNPRFNISALAATATAWRNVTTEVYT